jgi:hypothetical protein
MALRRPRLARTDAGRPQRELGEVDTVVSASRHASRSVPTKHGLWLAGDGRLEEDNEKKKLRELERDRARPWSVVVMVNRAAALARIYIPCQRDDAIRRLHRWPCLCRGRTRWGRWATTRDGASTEALPARTTARCPSWGRAGLARWTPLSPASLTRRALGDGCPASESGVASML